MISKVEVRTPQGYLLTLELNDISDGLLLADVKGLDPVKATLASSSFAGVKGSHFQGSHRESRNILMSIVFVPDGTASVAALRNGLYRYFMSENLVNMTFYNDEGLVVVIDGVVESNDSPLFSEEPQADISIMCFDEVDFTGPTPVVVTGMLTSDATSRAVAYSGTVDTGILLELDVNRAMSGFSIYHTLPSGELRTLDFQAPLLAGDTVTLSTVQGSKYITLVRTGTTSSLLWAVTPQSNWIQLANGTNHLQVYAEGEGVPLTITYSNKYGGL